MRNLSALVISVMLVCFVGACTSKPVSERIPASGNGDIDSSSENGWCQRELGKVALSTAQIQNLAKDPKFKPGAIDILLSMQNNARAAVLMTCLTLKAKVPSQDIAFIKDHIETNCKNDIAKLQSQYDQVRANPQLRDFVQYYESALEDKQAHCKDISRIYGSHYPSKSSRLPAQLESRGNGDIDSSTNLNLKLACGDINKNAKPWLMFVFDIKNEDAIMGFIKYPFSTAEIMLVPNWYKDMPGSAIVPRKNNIYADWADGQGGVLRVKKVGDKFNGSIYFPEGDSAIGVREGGKFKVSCHQVERFQ